MDVIRHFVQRRAREENLLHAFALHRLCVGLGDCPSTAAENFDVVRAFFLQLFHNVGEKLDVPAVVTRNADRAHVLLDGGAHDIADRAMVSEINDFDAVPNEFEIDRVDGAVVPVTNRDGSENSDW